MTKYFYILFILFVFLQASDKEYQLLISEGNNNFELGELDKAVLNFKKAIKINKKLPEAYMNLGYIHLQKTYYKVAKRYFENAEMYKSKFIYKEKILELKRHRSEIKETRKKPETDKDT